MDRELVVWYMSSLLYDSLVESLLVIRVDHALEFGYSLTPLLTDLFLALLSIVEGC